MGWAGGGWFSDGKEKASRTRGNAVNIRQPFSPPLVAPGSHVCVCVFASVSARGDSILSLFFFFLDSFVKLSGILRASQLHSGGLTVSLRARQSDSTHRLIGSSVCRTVRSHLFSRGGCVAVLYSFPSPQPLRCCARLCLRVASSRPSLLLSLRISSFLCHFVFSLISAPPSSTSSALSLSIPSLLHAMPPHRWNVERNCRV